MKIKNPSKICSLEIEINEKSTHFSVCARDRDRFALFRIKKGIFDRFFTQPYAVGYGITGHGFVKNQAQETDAVVTLLVVSSSGEVETLHINMEKFIRKAHQRLAVAERNKKAAAQKLKEPL